MTDTGQVPGEGQPESAGAQPEQPDVPAPGAYFADPATGSASAEEDDLLLMPGTQAWSDAAQQSPRPVRGAHETDGRHSGSIDYGAVRMPPSAPGGHAAQGEQPAPPSGGPTPRRPLHLGPPVPEQSGAVRSLADRGPTVAATPPPARPVPATHGTGRQAGPPTLGPEYLDVTQEDPAAPPSGAWHSQAPAPTGVATVDHTPEGPLPGPDLAAVPATPAHPTPVPPAVAKAPAPTEPAPAQSAEPEPTATAEAPAPPPVRAPVPAEPAPAEPAPAEPTPAEPAGSDPQLVMAAVPGAGQQVVEAVPAAAPPPVAQAQPEEPQPGEPQDAPAPAGDPSAPSAVPTPPAADVPVVPAPRSEDATVPGTPVENASQPEPAHQHTEPSQPSGPSGPSEPVEPSGAAAPEPTAPEPTAPEPAAPEPVAPEASAAPIRPESPAPGYPEAEREALHRVMRERRDIRNGFRPDPIPHEVLLRVLEAAHTAPSVGHSQPWDFVIIRSEETRRTMHDLAAGQRETYAKSLPKARAKQFKELKIEAILDTPVNIVVTADPTRGGRHTLGRQTQPQMAPYSSALAVENLWLAARAEGLGVGWVSFFDEREMVRALGLPEHLEVVAYLCVGYVDAFPEEPELMQSGWSKRRPLSWVVHEESYGRRALPGADPHDLLAETLGGIRPLDAKALGEAWERQKRMTKPAGALGMLEIISAQLSGLARQCPPPIPEPAAVAVFAGDHGVHSQGVTAWPQEVTAQMVANFLGGGAVCNAFANQVGAEVCVVDVGVVGELPSTPGLLPRKVRAGTADFTSGPALEREEVLRAIEVGIETARDLVAAGNKALLTGEMGIANTTVSAALIAVYTGSDPAEVTGRGTGVGDEMHARKIDVVRRALELHQPEPADPIGVLAAVGGLEHAAIAGLILGGASLRTPVVLDGVSAGAAALVARAIAPEALAACIAGHRSAEPGHVAALTKLGLRPLVDLDLRLGEGTGALLALPVVQSAARAMHEVATFDSAGVTEKN